VVGAKPSTDIAGWSGFLAGCSAEFRADSKDVRLANTSRKPTVCDIGRSGFASHRDQSDVKFRFRRPGAKMAERLFERSSRRAALTFR
jgi:hypothetical protein